LSHCLFDFDCVDLNVYERETYNYQEFSLDSLGALPADKTSNVTNNSKFEMHIMLSLAMVTREGIKVSLQPF